MLEAWKAKRRPPSALPLPKTRNEDNAVLRRQIGTRFKEARLLMGWDQIVAAKKLGYENSTQISLVEKGARMPPIGLVIHASQIYAVSVDFLVGESEEPNRDPKQAEKHAVLRHVAGMLGKHTEVVTSAVLQYLSHGAPAVVAARELHLRVDAAVDAIRRLRELNPEAFDGELRGGATVLAACDELATAAIRAKSVLERRDREVEFAIGKAEKRAGMNRPLFDQLTEE